MYFRIISICIVFIFFPQSSWAEEGPIVFLFDTSNSHTGDASIDHTLGIFERSRTAFPEDSYQVIPWNTGQKIPFWWAPHNKSIRDAGVLRGMGGSTNLGFALHSTYQHSLLLGYDCLRVIIIVDGVPGDSIVYSRTMEEFMAQDFVMILTIDTSGLAYYEKSKSFALPRTNRAQLLTTDSLRTAVDLAAQHSCHQLFL